MKRWENKSWTRSMRMMLDFGGMMADAVGRRYGLTVKQIDDMSEPFKIVHQNLKQRRRAGDLPFYELPYDQWGG